MQTRVRWVWLSAWAAGLVALVVALLGRFGFNPTDQGYVLAQAWQVRHGAVPHLEAVSSRPFGSAVLHQVDFWLPGPLYLSSMFLSVLEVVLLTVWLAVLVLDRPVRSWGIPTLSLVTAAVLVNVHTFPLMAWPTIDGVALVSGGLLAVSRGARRGSVALCCLGALACGFAPLTKQSFAAAPVLALVLLRSQREGRLRVWGCLALPALGYLAWVVAGGGLGPMTDQLLGGKAVYGLELVTGAAELLWHRPELSLLCALLLAVLTSMAVTQENRVLRAEAGFFVLVLVALVGSSGLVVGGSWGALVFWVACVTLLVRAVREGRAPTSGSLLVVAVAWMVSLSWGYANPDLVAGSLLLLTLVETWRVAGGPAPRSGRALVAAGVVGVLATGALVLDARQQVYVEGPRSTLTEDAGAFAPGLRGVRTTPRTLAYLREISQCLREHPAAHVAVLPDNAAIYPLLGLQDPFPQVWVLPEESYGDVPAMLVAAARQLDRADSFLVLFQTYSAFDINVVGSRLEPADLFVPGLQHALADALHGDSVRCGSFVGEYRAGSPAR